MVVILYVECLAFPSIKFHKLPIPSFFYVSLTALYCSFSVDITEERGINRHFNNSIITDFLSFC